MESGGPNRSRISVLDVGGRLIRTLYKGVAEPGRFAVEWDGRDPQGKRVASGAYFLRFRPWQDQPLPLGLILLR